jgi:hypothetical protein
VDKFKLTLSEEHMKSMLIMLRDVAQECLSKKVPYVVSDVCSVVANLIASAGPHGGTGQTRMMDLASKVGFSPEYYNDTIRVGYYPKEKSNG